MQGGPNIRAIGTKPQVGIECRDLRGDGDRGNPTGMEASVAGFLRGWKQMLQDSRGDGKIFYGIPA